MEESIMSDLQQKNIRRVLARKYRPKFLKDVIGQDLLVQSLSKGILEKRLPQSILLHGIRGTGKTSTARILARSINCIGNQGEMTLEPCCVCKSCKAIEDDSHIDVIEMDAASHTGVDDIREIIDSARYKAVIGRYKVFIIDEVHMLSKSAFNALLKTLEEPPSHVLFIFATTEINKIPDTILSRCARFDLKRIEAKDLISHMKKICALEGYEIDDDAVTLIARAADGSVRDSLTLLDQAMNLTDSVDKTIIETSLVQNMLGTSDRKIIFDILSNVIKSNHEEVISKVRFLVSNGSDPVVVMQDLLECLYHVACFKTMPKLSTDETIPEFERKMSNEIATYSNEMQLLGLWKILLKSYNDVKTAPFANQAVEMSLLRSCFATQLPTIEELLSEKKTQNFDELKKNSNGNVTVEQKKETSSKIISTESDLIYALESGREALLLSYINKDIAFVSVEHGKITLQLRNEESSKIVPLLKQFLQKETKVNWLIEIVTSSNAKTNEEKSIEIKKSKEDEVLNSTIINKIKKVYPEAKIEFEN